MVLEVSNTYTNVWWETTPQGADDTRLPKKSGKFADEALEAGDDAPESADDTRLPGVKERAGWGGKGGEVEEERGAGVSKRQG